MHFCEKKIRNHVKIIVVDNDEEKIIETELKKKFPSVIYLKPEKNLNIGCILCLT